MTPQSVLALAPVSSSQVDSFVSHFIDELEGGRLDPLKVLMQCKGMEEAIKGVKDAVKAEAINEAQKHGNGTHLLNGFKFSVVESGTKYDFEGTGDPIWKSLSTKLKDRQEMLKKVSGHIAVCDPDTGEEVNITRAVKSSTTTVKLEMQA